MIKYFLKVTALSVLIGAAIYYFFDKLQASQETPIFEAVTLSYYLKPQTPFSWFMDYFPFIAIVAFTFSNLVVFFLELLLIEPSYAPRHYASNLLHLIKQPTPNFDHLSDTLYTCPNLDPQAIKDQLNSDETSKKI